MNKAHEGSAMVQRYEMVWDILRYRDVGGFSAISRQKNWEQMGVLQ